MNQEKNILIFIHVLGILLLLTHGFAYRLNRERRSGISDQRLAELETLLALSKLKTFHSPVAYGLLDLEKIGKRKRSIEYLDEEEKPFYPVDFGGGEIKYGKSDSETWIPLWRKKVGFNRNE